MTTSTLFALKRAYQATRQALEAHLQTRGVTAAQFDVLKLLLLAAPPRPVPTGGLDQRTIQSDLGVTSATLTRLLAGMERRGLVSRAPHPHDSRGKRVQASAKARKLFARLMEEGEAAFLARVFRGFSAQDTRRFTGLLERVAENLRTPPPRTDHPG